MRGLNRIFASLRREERGAALMIVLVMLVGLTILGAAGLTLSETDIRHSESVEASAGAFYAADAGLQRYMGEAQDGSSGATYTIGGATVVVSATPMGKLNGMETMHRLRSVATATDARGATTSRAVNGLGIYVPAPSATVTAALASGSGLSKNGGSGAIEGYDHASVTDPVCKADPRDDVAGVSVPLAGYNQSGGSPVPAGDPDIDYQTSGLEVLQETGIDWATLSAGGGGFADYTVPPDAWPNFASIPADEWPVIYASGDLTVAPGNTGRGTIIVRGDLTMSGSFAWKGLMLVGGKMTSSGSQTIEGGMITGLNLLLGESVGESDIGSGSKEFLYNSCYTRFASWAFAEVGGMVFVPGSWEEEF